MKMRKVRIPPLVRRAVLYRSLSDWLRKQGRHHEYATLVHWMVMRSPEAAISRAAYAWSQRHWNAQARLLGRRVG